MTVKLFCPSTNTFITPNMELGLSLIEMRNIFGLPTLKESYEEFNPLNYILERENEEFRTLFQQVFALAKMSRDSRHKFKAGTWIKNMLQKEPVKKITFLESPNVFKKIVAIEPSSWSPKRRKPKYSTSYVDCPEFSTYLERTCSESMPRRCLAAMYLAV